MADAPISEELTALKKRARRRLVGAIALVLAALVVLWTVMDDKPPQSLASQPVSIVSTEPALTTTVGGQGKLAAPDAPSASPAATPSATPTPPPAVAPPVAAEQSPAIKPPVAVVPVIPATTEPHPTPVATHEAKPTPKPTLTPHTDVAQKKPEKSEKSEKTDVASNSTTKKPTPAADPARILAGLDDHPAAAHASDSASGHFFLQLGAFADSDKAKSLVSKAASAGVTVQREVVSTDKGALSRLRAGPYATHEAAEHARAKLVDAGMSATVVGK